MTRYHKRPTGEQQTPEWYEARRQYIGASDVASVLNAEPAGWGSAHTVWRSKVSSDFAIKTTWLMKAGSVLEGLILDWWSEKTGGTYEREPCTLIHAEEERMGANLDAWAFVDGKQGIVDAKLCTRWEDRAHVQELERGEATPQGKWAAYWLQLQQQMEVADVEFGYLAVLMLPSIFIIRWDRDREFGAVLRANIRGFWGQHVATGIAPPAKRGDREAVAYIKATPEKTESRPDLAEDIEKLRALKVELSALKNAVEDLATDIKARIGDAEVVLLGEGIKKATYKANKNNTRTLRV